MVKGVSSKLLFLFWSKTPSKCFVEPVEAVNPCRIVQLIAFVLISVLSQGTITFFASPVPETPVDATPLVRWLIISFILSNGFSLE